MKETGSWEFGVYIIRKRVSNETFSRK